MSKRPNAATDIYTRHLTGTAFQHNPTSERTAIIERMYQRLITELACNRFKWSGVPETVDVRFMELTLFQRALSVFYYDEDYESYFALQGASTGFLNMMNNPTAFTVVGNNFTGKTLGAYQPWKKTDEDDKRKAVPIWSNYLRIPDWDIMQIYSTRMAQMDRTVEVNSQNARRNKVIMTTDNMRLSAVNISRQLDEAYDNVQVNSEGPLGDMGFVQAIDMGINVSDIEKLHIVRTRQWNECMGLLGIENANQDKKERLVSSEVDANNDQTSMMRYVNLNARQTACEHINKIHGLNMSVEYNEEVDKMAENVAQSMGISDESENNE